MQESMKANKKMIYSFRQNNSCGFYHPPAKHIIVKKARDSEHATEIALASGMYLDGVAAGADCSWCGDRWYGMSDEHETLEDAVAYISEFDFGDKSVPQYIVVDDLDIEDTVLE